MSTIVPGLSFGTPPPGLLRKFSVDEYHRMIDAGILTEEDAVELLEGWIVPKMPRKPSHDGVIHRVTKLLRRHLPQGWEPRVQSALTTSDSEPEPDIAVVRATADDYISRHPGPADVGLLIEVADTTLAWDRGEKARIYARAGIPYYWIVNLVDGCVEVFRDPASQAASPHYQGRTQLFPPASVEVILDGQAVATLAVAELMP